MNDPQKLPSGWDDSRMREVIQHYDGQTEDEQADEIEAAFASDDVTLIAVPAELADEVRALVAARRSA